MANYFDQFEVLEEAPQPLEDIQKPKKINNNDSYWNQFEVIEESQTVNNQLPSDSTVTQPTQQQPEDFSNLNNIMATQEPSIIDKGLNKAGDFINNTLSGAGNFVGNMFAQKPQDVVEQNNIQPDIKYVKGQPLQGGVVENVNIEDVLKNKIASQALDAKGKLHYYDKDGNEINYEKNFGNIKRALKDKNYADEFLKVQALKDLNNRFLWEQNHPFISGLQKAYQPGYSASVEDWKLQKNMEIILFQMMNWQKV